ARYSRQHWAVRRVDPAGDGRARIYLNRRRHGDRDRLCACGARGQYRCERRSRRDWFDGGRRQPRPNCAARGSSITRLNRLKMMTEPKLKILICLLYYLPHRTGMQLYIQRIAEEMVKRGHQVTVLCAQHKSELDYDETINGVRIVRLRVRIPVSRGMLMPAYPYAAYKLMREHDIVSVHTPMLETALLSVIGKLTGRKIIPTHH